MTFDILSCIIDVCINRTAYVALTLTQKGFQITMMKKLLALSLACLMLLCSVACKKDKNATDGNGLDDFKEEVVVYNTHVSGSDIYYFEDIDSETVKITGYKGSNDIHDIVIPTTVTAGTSADPVQKRVAAIDNCAFYSVSALRKVTLPEQLETVGEFAFAFCAQLETVVLPTTLTSIGKGAFQGSAINALSIPEGSQLSSISDWAFAECTKLTEINLPGCIKTVGQSAFLGCTGVTKITLAEGVTTLGELAFARNTSLAELTLPATLTNSDPRTDLVFTGSPVLYRENITAPAGSVAESYVENMVLNQMPED